ncbi:hypothetical protein BGZ51_006134 [Haplosporangium sp. Z 767]|nr:hypothetical protein BGZ51_006134 [Haplosporangium sp. Z 767]
MTLSAKAQVIERDFQNARAKANYAAFPEFARRYVKHNKDGIVLANSALLEMAVAEAEMAARKAQQWSPLASLDDTPQSLAVSPLIKPDMIQEAVEKVERVLSKGPEEHQEFAAIVLARAAFATDAPDRLQRVAHYLQNIQLPPARVPTGYNFILVACGLTIKGMTLEEEGRIPEAVVAYDSVSLLVQSNPNEKGEELNSWAEHALYRAGMLKLRQNDYLAAIRSFRVYHSQALQWPGNFRLPRRASLYRHFSLALSEAFKSFGYHNPSNGTQAVPDDQSHFYPVALASEMAQIHAYWEDALYAVTTFPRADEKNWRVLEMIERIVQDRKLTGLGNDADKRALVETIYRATQKTFQSPRILRCLFFALVEMGQYDEAELALKAYLDMVEINLKVKSTTPDETLTNDQRIRLDIESEYDITTVMIEGSRLYAKELGKPEDALNCAKNALDNIHKNLQQHEDVALLLNRAYKFEAAAYGMQAVNAHEPEKRPDLYAKAVASLEKAIKILPEAFDGHYMLALQLAEMRDIARATLAVKESLSLNTTHIPSWHLLALLLSSQKEYERALDICAVGLKESDWDLAQTDAFSASQVEGEEYLSFRLTQAVLHDKVYGAEAALEPQEALFGLYTKVFAPEPNSMGDSLYDIHNIRRRDHSEIDLTLSTAVTGRPRAGSILSVRSRNGAGSDAGQVYNGSNNNTLDIVKPNYASSIASSIGSTNSKHRRIPPPAAAAAHATVGKSLLSLPPTVQRPTTKSVMRTARANKVLVTLWLLSASTFRRLGRMEDALKAIEEAEHVDASNADVWYQLGLLYAAQHDQDTASVSFSKALALAPYHPACLTRVGQSYLEAGSLEMAEGILETTTKSLGWDSAEAWFYLGKVFEASTRLSRAKECLWYALDLENSRPILDDLVMVNVRQIAEMGAYVQLLEYDNIEGMILLSELSRRRIRSIQKLIRVGRNEVVVVLRVDKEKGYIDLSKRRVSPADIVKCEERYNKSKAVHSIMSTVAKKENKDLEALYEQLAWPLYAKYGHAYDAFKAALNEPEKVFEGQDIAESTLEELLNNIKRRLTPQPIKIRADIEVTCFDYEGIDAIKTAFKEAEAASLPDVPIRVKLVAPPLYVMITNALDKQLGIDTMEKAIVVLEESIKKSNGNMVTKMSPKAVTEADDMELDQLLARIDKENAEVSGDDDESESDADV